MVMASLSTIADDSSSNHIQTSPIGKRPQNSSVLVVGAGGIGCELLKSLALCHFNTIGVIDLDTIEVSNLNRQFLFHKEHVGQSKAQVACETIKKLCPHIQIEPYHGDVITDARFDLNFYKKYDLIINALDNVQARQHVNRMCLQSSKPLIDSGSTGYNGQATIILKGRSQCYDCVEKPKQQRTYAVCTIRNTPSQPIHCIVWAKYLYQQLFGDNDDPNQEDVTPDQDDPENLIEKPTTNGNGDQHSEHFESNQLQPSHRLSTRDWIRTNDFDAQKIFNKLYNDDIKYLASMKNLWEKRRQPIPLNYDQAIQLNEDDYDKQATTTITTMSNTSTIPKLNDQKICAISDYVQMFCHSIQELRKRFILQQQLASSDSTGSEPKYLIWDKNDDADLRFVTSASNLRAYIFGIVLTSKFDVKSMAGNIIPAVATTNAIVAGITVLQATKILATLTTDHHLTSIQHLSNVFVSTDRSSGAIIQRIPLEEPNEQCLQCNEQERPVRVRLNMSLFTLRSLEEKLIRKHLKMSRPDVFISDGRILISADDDNDDNEDDKNEVKSKTLDKFKLLNGTILTCEEEDENEIKFKIKLMLEHSDAITDKDDYVVVDDQVIREIEQIHQQQQQQQPTKKRKLSEQNDDDVLPLEDQGEIIKKTKRLSESNKHNGTTTDETDYRPPTTEFVIIVDDEDKSSEETKTTNGELYLKHKDGNENENEKNYEIMNKKMMKMKHYKSENGMGDSSSSYVVLDDDSVITTENNTDDDNDVDDVDEDDDDDDDDDGDEYCIDISDD
ncbi:unnamed protein product [Didymodactylos carnosus]|uniref:SUMO-activating enzyme subunit n=1 Tax=Didymodactylos carnosus TaxID=1234261 RepID=A0A814BUH7_9BILA|nr:unnamed protein product [Didymodactylos carnosus]CAF3712281.1 unnamed protein product [Didymodactylos carnosus]